MSKPRVVYIVEWRSVNPESQWRPLDNRHYFKRYLAEEECRYQRGGALSDGYFWRAAKYVRSEK